MPLNLYNCDLNNPIFFINSLPQEFCYSNKKTVNIEVETDIDIKISVFSCKSKPLHERKLAKMVVSLI
jgi:hypothetical protein